MSPPGVVAVAESPQSRPMTCWQALFLSSMGTRLQMPTGGRTLIDRHRALNESRLSSGWAAGSQAELEGLGKVSIPADEADRCQAAAVERRLLFDGSC